MNQPTQGRPSDAERTKALDAAMAYLDKQYGIGTVMRLGDQARLQVEVIPTGSMALDRATGIGGYPQGRVVEIYGPESSGKTTLTLHAIASCQARGGVAAFVDAEHALDPGYARRVGVDVDSLLVSQPDNGEQALEIVEKLVSSGAIDLVVIDSVAALVPQAELEGEMGDTQVGLQARLMSKALRKITGVASRHNATVIFINQLRQKIGVSFGPSEVTTGGNALKFYASLRLDVRKIGMLKRGKEEVPYGNQTRVKVVKNKLAPPFRKVEFEIHYGTGISTEIELLNLALHQGIVRRNGSWFSLGEEKLGQGLENARERLIAEPDLRNRLLSMIHGTSSTALDVIDVEVEPAEAK